MAKKKKKEDENIMETEATANADEPVAVRLSFSEFYATLTGADIYVGAAMRTEYKNKKMTKEEWQKEFNQFANREVK